MHVLFVASYYPSHRQPFTGIFIQRQAEALHRAGHTVGVLAMPRINVTAEHVRTHAGRPPAAYAVEQTVPFPVIRMHWGWFPRPLPFVVAPLLADAACEAFAQYCRRFGRPDILYAHNVFYGGHAAAAIKRRFGVPAALVEHSTSFLEGLIMFPGQKPIIRKTLGQMDHVFAVGGALAGALHAYVPPIRIEVLGNLVDTELFVMPPVPPSIEPFVYTLIALMKERRKGFDLLVKAFASAFAGDLAARLVICGDGPLRDEIEGSFSEMHIQQQAIVIPLRPPDALRELMWQSGAVVCASSVETFGLTVAEAMACGRPVVVTACGGPEDFVEPDTGVIVPAGDVQALADGLRQARARYHEFSPEAARQRIVERYSEAAIVRRLEEAFSRAIDRR